MHVWDYSTQFYASRKLIPSAEELELAPLEIEPILNSSPFYNLNFNAISRFII